MLASIIFVFQHAAEPYEVRSQRTETVYQLNHIFKIKHPNISEKGSQKSSACVLKILLKLKYHLHLTVHYT